MNAAEFREFWAVLESYYPEAAKKPRSAKNAWYAELKCYEKKDAVAAVRAIARNLRFMPALSEILDELQEQGAQPKARALFTREQIEDSVAWMRKYLEDTEGDASEYYKVHHSAAACQQEEQPADHAEPEDREAVHHAKRAV